RYDLSGVPAPRTARRTPARGGVREPFPRLRGDAPRPDRAPQCPGERPGWCLLLVGVGRNRERVARAPPRRRGTRLRVASAARLRVAVGPVAIDDGRPGGV